MPVSENSVLLETACARVGDVQPGWRTDLAETLQGMRIESGNLLFLQDGLSDVGIDRDDVDGLTVATRPVSGPN